MTAEAVANPVTEQIIGEHPKGTDLVIRVRTLEVDSEKFVDIREFVPSSETYGRGVLVPTGVAAAVAQAVKAASRL